MEQILAGPKTPGNFPTLPAEAKVLSVTVVDKICYVNFDEEFADPLAMIAAMQQGKEF